MLAGGGWGQSGGVGVAEIALGWLSEATKGRAPSAMPFAMLAGASAAAKVKRNAEILGFFLL